MNYLLTLLLVANLSTSVPAQSSNGFVLESQEDGVKVYVREESNGELSVRAMTRARSQVHRVQEVLDDAAHYPDWVHRCDGAYILDGGASNDYIFVSGIDMPFPFRDKEVVARVTQQMDHAGILTRTITASPTAIPPTEGRDREEVYTGKWVISPLASGEVRLQCTVRTDAGAGLPKWLRKEIMTGGPAKTIANLRRRLEMVEG